MAPVSSLLRSSPSGKPLSLKTAKFFSRKFGTIQPQTGSDAALSAGCQSKFRRAGWTSLGLNAGVVLRRRWRKRRRGYDIRFRSRCLVINQLPRLAEGIDDPQIDELQRARADR